MRAAAEELGLTHSFDIAVGEEEVPFICDLEFQEFVEAFPMAPRTPLGEAVRASIEVFCDQVRRGWLLKSSLT